MITQLTWYPFAALVIGVLFSGYVWWQWDKFSSHFFFF